MRTALRRAAVLAAAAALPLLGAQPASATSAEPQQPPAPQATTIYYDASGAAEFQQAVDQAAQVWNDSLQNVQLEPGTGSPGFDVLADDGWPRAQVTSLGSGTVWMGRIAVNEGYHVPRIATHEIGHILGLPDRRTGVCEDLMSGSSAPVDCANVLPNAAEIAEVEENFAGTARADARVAFAGEFSDCYGVRNRAC